MRLLEVKNDPLGIGISVDNGALLNYEALHHQNGALTGCTLTNQNGAIYILPGTLAVQGFRLQVDENEAIFNTSTLTVSSGYNLVLRVTFDAVNNSAEFQVLALPDTNALKADEIQTKKSGSFDLLLATFTKSGETISAFTQKLKTIDVVNPDNILDYQTINL